MTFVNGPKSGWRGVILWGLPIPFIGGIAGYLVRIPGTRPVEIIGIALMIIGIMGIQWFRSQTWADGINSVNQTLKEFPDGRVLADVEMEWLGDQLPESERETVEHLSSVDYLVVHPAGLFLIVFDSTDNYPDWKRVKKRYQQHYDCLNDTKDALQFDLRQRASGPVAIYPVVVAFRRSVDEIKQVAAGINVVNREHVEQLLAELSQTDTLSTDTIEELVKYFKPHAA